MGTALVGIVLWALLIAWACKGRQRAGASPSTAAVSGNTPTGTGPKWEQDVPYALTIDYDREDDL